MTYDEIASSCGLETSDLTAIEDVVLQSVQNQLIECRIDQRQRRIHVLNVSATVGRGRDVPANRLPELVQ